MRAAIIGVALDDLDQLVEFVRASSRMTHTDEKAEYGAIAVALAARHARRDDAIEPTRFVDQLSDLIANDESGHELIELLAAATDSVSNGESTSDFAIRLGLEKGVTGYTYHTIPIAIHAWFSHPRDYHSAVTAAIRCGGDTDTVAAIVGGIVGTTVGESGIPDEWINGLWEWPRTVGWMHRLGAQLAETLEQKSTERPVELSMLFLGLRNLLFLLLVLGHGFRRLLPPY